jgi:hypothetical protein
MPLVVLLLLIPLAVLAAIALLPLSLVMRYRVGTARGPARGWMIALNLIAIGMSTGLFLLSSAVTSAWIPRAFPYTLLGLAAGALLGLLGLAWTRWEATPSALYYTPSRPLTLAVTLLVTARVLFGFWRSWRAWGAGAEYSSWIAASDVAGSMAAGAVVLGYYLAYWLGVRRRLRRYQRFGYQASSLSTSLSPRSTQSTRKH